MSRVKEANLVRAEVKGADRKAHFGMIAELCFEKGSELLKGDPERKFKGRHVFLGDNVKDEFFNWASRASAVIREF